MAEDTESVAMQLKINSERTEMGIKVTILSKEVNIMVEFDIEEDPIKAQALLHLLPQVMNDAVQRLVYGNEGAFLPSDGEAKVLDL